MQPYLPQTDPEPRERQNRLEHNRTLYVFNYDYVPPIPMLDEVPEKEKFSKKYVAARLASMYELVPNLLAARTERIFDPFDELDEFDDLFKLMRKPAVSKIYRTDESFAEQRLSGANPQAMRRVDELPDDFPVTDAHVAGALGEGRSLASELREGRLYFLDFPNISHVEGGTYNGQRKYLPKPRALFGWDARAGQLKPVAIQIAARPDARVFTPADAPNDWFLAKTCVQIADANCQELGTHFAWCHVVMAPFAVVTNRQLAENHPVHLMLKPHFRFMLHDNDLGRTQFIQPDGPVEHMLAGTREESIGISAAYYKEWDLMKAAHPVEVAGRGMDDADVLPHYPFRDDGMLIWREIERYVRAYLGLYYKSPDDLAADHELQAWARELAADDGGRVAGMPERIDTIDQLVEVLTIVIYTCAPLHSALNFAQYEYIGYVANMPYGAYHPIPDNGGVDPATIMKIMPPFDQALLQLKWTEILTSYHYDRLGHYDEPFEDPAAQALVEEFQQRLELAEREIERRNISRPVAYDYMKPSQIINSINT